MMKLRHAILALMLLLNLSLLAVAWRVVSYRRAEPARTTSVVDVATVPTAETEPVNPAARTAVAEPSAPVTTALAAYNLAEPLARGWAADALLLQARGDWRQGTFSPELENWVFLFYSAGLEATAQINVVGGMAQLVASSGATGLTAPAAAEAWRVDSDTIIASFLDGAGGKLFIGEREDVSMVLTLTVGAGAVWTATLVDWETGDVFGRDFDAHSGFLAAEL